MLDLRRLRLLRELSQRGTIAAVADALQFTPSAVSQQLAMLEREAGVRLLERAGRGVRLTDAARVLVEHAEAMLDRAALADVDFVLGDEWQHGPLRLPAGVQRHDLFRDPVQLVLPARHPAARRHTDAVPLAELAGEAWTTGHPGMGWDEMTQRTCRDIGGFDPDIRHRTHDATVSLALVASGLAVTRLPPCRALTSRAGAGGGGPLRRTGRSRACRTGVDARGAGVRGSRCCSPWPGGNGWARDEPARADAAGGPARGRGEPGGMQE